MNEQPEALRLADLLEQQFPLGTAQHYLDGEAAAELRRLHEANEAFGKRQEWWNDRMVELEAALRQAVEALNTARPACFAETTLTAIDEAITAAKQALGGA